ncbi:hypothetical protein M406DRAFT_74062 [Cryphonectria parasitica EP155]|uniref:Uncharacterized protein n=1 Tax=Cryphonectria parasitica (strain ATCC 38755 / EP155) TaxID=660469 RepID=A0A9P4XY55_CRYP1|nr:uncharacterized protein M406DRAFT_74062 [Cryphonectria parasitica EP155]KAF3763449.1 hypothetical protein M406DRAFT_74062 [Cryphonectria parasitica EP155]
MTARHIISELIIGLFMDFVCSNLSNLKKQFVFDETLPAVRTFTLRGLAHTHASAGRDFTQTDLKALQGLGGWTPLNTSTPFSYVPSWTHPLWREDVEIAFDGTWYKVRQKLGDPAASMRPALRPEDEARHPTEYARRFGVHTDRQRDNWGHSRMTPTDPSFQPSVQSFEGDEYDRSLQNIVFDYDTAELAKIGALNPRLDIAWPPDLDDPVDTLFDPMRWTQMSMPGWKDWSGLWDVRYGPSLDGVGGVYNYQTNEKVREALRPALQLVSKIMRSGHPYWQAMTSLHHLRPVDNAKDGRTSEERSRQGGVPYTSVWIHVDGTDARMPTPYPEMQRLNDLGFDSRLARNACMSLLYRFLQFSIYLGENNSGMVRVYQDQNVWAPRLCISATLIWPLLVPKNLSDSERASHTFAIASTILHELAHACAHAHRCLMTRTLILKKTPIGAALGEEILNSLLRLGNQVFGPMLKDSQGFQTRPSRNDFFAEDAAQGEEGLNFEKYLWGNRIIRLPRGGSSAFMLMPIIATSDWPVAHPQPYQQGKTKADQRDTAYMRWLVEPRVQSWNEITAVPVAWYARLFQKTWWQSNYRKYGHQGLLLACNDGQALSDQRARSVPLFPIENDPDDMVAVLGSEAYTWLRDTMARQLADKGLRVLRSYITAMMCLVAESAILATRLANEEAGWAHKCREMQRLALRVARCYTAMVNAIHGDMATPSTTASFTVENAKERIRALQNSVRPALQNMMQLRRVIDQEIAYQQNILNMYLLQGQNFRKAFRSYIVALRKRMTITRDLLNGQRISVSLADLGDDAYKVGGGWQEIFEQKLETDLACGTNGMIPKDLATESHLLLEMLNEVRTLHTGFQLQVDMLEENNNLAQSIGPDGSVDLSLYGQSRLRSVTRARRTGFLRAYRTAAMREMRRLADGPMKRLVREAVGILSSYMDIRQIEGDLRVLRSETERRNDLMRDVYVMLTNERQFMADRQVARDAGQQRVTEDPTVQDLRVQVLQKAGGHTGDRAYLASIWTNATIQKFLDGMDQEPLL